MIVHIDRACSLLCVRARTCRLRRLSCLNKAMFLRGTDDNGDHDNEAGFGHVLLQ